MRLDIRYRVHFRYTDDVSESQNEVRMRPCDDEYQRVLAYRLISDPSTHVLHTLDYWGTAVDHLGVRASHRELELVAESTVETSPRPAPTGDEPVSALRSDEFRSEYFEFLEPSGHVMWLPADAVAQRAAAASAGAASVSALVSTVAGEARRALAYERGTTEIGVSLEDLVAGGSGVCQDFAHLAIGMLRSVGVPARYVSGYLFAADETAPADAVSVYGAAADMPPDCSEGGTDDGAAPSEPMNVSVQTHAWIEAAVPGLGWWALDPTNGGMVGERHVVIGCGRDYGDVPPVRGAFLGDASAEVESEVVIEWRPALDGGTTASTTRLGKPDITGASATAGRNRQQQQQQQ